MYEANFHSGFKKDIKKLRGEIVEKLKAVIDEVCKTPLDFDMLSGDLLEVYSYKFKLNKVDYRLAYIADEEKKTVTFLMFKKRENFYDYLKKRFK